MIKKTILLAIIFLNGCTSLAGGAMVFTVASHDKTVEKKGRQYNAISPCKTQGRPDAYLLAEQIRHGYPVTREYGYILSPVSENEEHNPPLPHHISYALYVIAARNEDTRAENRKRQFEQYLAQQEAENIKNLLERKYLTSYLNKCFSVPAQYRRHRTPREIILERF